MTPAMDASVWGPVLLAIVLGGAGTATSWRLIWPPYKRVGKLAFYLVVSVALAYVFGWWSLVFVTLHPLSGLVGQIWWCRKHGLDIWRPDVEAYVQTQKDWAASLDTRWSKPPRSGP